MTQQRAKGKKAGLFSEAEAEYLAENFICRLATVSPSGQPHVVPVSYRFDGKSIHFGGWNLKHSLKFRNLADNAHVAIVVDDIVSSRPWKARGLEIRGTAEPYVSGGETRVRIEPKEVRGWGLGGSAK